MARTNPDPRDAELAALREQLAAAQAAAAAATVRRVSFKVSEKGALSVYGLGRFPVTLYRGQWEALIGHVPAIREFIAANADRLATKP